MIRRLLAWLRPRRHHEPKALVLVDRLRDREIMRRAIAAMDQFDRTLRELGNRLRGKPPIVSKEPPVNMCGRRHWGACEFVVPFGRSHVAQRCVARPGRPSF